ncbi:MAG: DinB family protein [Rubrivivax sp.]|nr:DinB family protein [Rubrivivax sp.]
MVDLAQSLRIQAHANALANLRLHAAMAPLTREELHKRRTSFFPTLMATLNHILAVDGYYIASLAGDPDPEMGWKRFRPHVDLAPLAAAQRESDLSLVAFTEALDADGCNRLVAMPRANGRVQRDRVAHVLAHLFMHQTHHRGQVHAMLAGTSVKPPQLDEFLMPSEAHLREAEMLAFDWSERTVYGLLSDA